MSPNKQITKIELSLCLFLFLTNSGAISSLFLPRDAMLQSSSRVYLPLKFKTPDITNIFNKKTAYLVLQRLADAL